MLTVAAYGAILFICIHISVRDVYERLIAHRDLFALCAVRAALLVLAEVQAACHIEGSGIFAGFNASLWSGWSLAQSMLCGLMVAMGMYLLGTLVSRCIGQVALGAGDVYFYAVACLFLSKEAVLWMLLGSAVVGCVMAFYCHFIRHSSTFPFAPAIAVSFLGVLALSLLLK